MGTARAVRRTAGSAADTCFVPVPGGVRGSPGRRRLMGGGRQRWGQTQGPRCPALGSFRGQGPSTRSGYGQTGLSSSLLWGERQGEDVQEKNASAKRQELLYWLASLRAAGLADTFHFGWFCQGQASRPRPSQLLY